jgi:hypothetical protein
MLICDPSNAKKGSAMIQVNGETITWKEICEWIERQYGIESEDRE